VEDSRRGAPVSSSEGSRLTWSAPLSFRAPRPVALVFIVPAAIAFASAKSWGSNMATVGTMQDVDVHH
jgi:hypothetical protein